MVMEMKKMIRGLIIKVNTSRREPLKLFKSSFVFLAVLFFGSFVFLAVLFFGCFVFLAVLFFGQFRAVSRF